MDPDQTSPIGAVCSGSTLFASILNSSVMLGNYLEQTTSAEDIFRRFFFFLEALRVNPENRVFSRRSPYSIGIVYKYFYIIWASTQDFGTCCILPMLTYSVWL